MKKTVTTSIIFFIGLCLFAQNTLPSNDWYISRTEQLAVTASIPMIQVAHRTPERNLMFEVANPNFDNQTASTDATSIFMAASISKVIFSYIVMRYVDRGMIDLDRPLYQYAANLFEKRFHNAILGDANHNARNYEWGKLLTARIVLSHGTGLPNWMRPEERGILKLVFNSKPDAEYTYSGEGISFLQQILEHITGKDLNTLANEEVFIPFGMTYTSFSWRKEYEKTHTFGYNANNVSIGRGFPYHDHAANAAFTMRTNVRDMSLFIEKAFLERYGLKPDTFKEWVSHQRKVGSDGSSYYGMGVRVNPCVGFDYGPVWHHSGSNGGFRCMFWVFPEKGTYFTYFSNSDHGEGAARRQLYDIFLSQFPGAW